MKVKLLVAGFLLMFTSPMYSQVNGKVISPSFSPVSSFVSYELETSSGDIVLTNRSSFKLEFLNIFPSCCGDPGPNKNGITVETANLQPGGSLKIAANYKGIKYFRSIAYKAVDMEWNLKTIPGESQDSYSQRYNKNNSRGCELMKLQAKMGKEVCQAINGTSSCFSDAEKVLEQNNWCDNSSGQSSKVEQPSTFQQQSTSQQQSNSNNLSTINDAIATTGNTIWDIIQSGRARKENTGKAIVNSFAQDLYESKKNIKYYDDVLCDKCNGSGTLIYNDNPNSIIYGQSHPCEDCNGIGRINQLKAEYKLTETHSQAFIDFAHYLLASESKLIPLCKLNPSGYKGSIEMKVRGSVGGHNDDLILFVETRFNFLDRKGKYDVNGYTYNSITDARVFPLNTIKSFEVIASKTESIEGTLFQYSSHIILNSTTGEAFEFTTDNNPSTVADRLNELLSTAKNSMAETSNNESGNDNNKTTSNSGNEQIIPYLNNKVNCCRIQGYSFFKNYDIDFDKAVSDKFSPNEGFHTPPTAYTIADKGNGVITLSLEDDFGKKFEYYFYLKICPYCSQHYQDRVYIIQSTPGKNGVDYGKIFRLLFADEESATDFFNAWQRLK
jgi:hypothetical protein